MATKELLGTMIEANGVDEDKVACILFTTTPDLDAEFPAAAAREMGWSELALLCGREIDVPNGLPRCVRILILFNTEKPSDEIAHIYLRGTEVLRQGTAQKSK